MTKTLVISGHPNLEEGSIANRRIIETLSSSGLDLSVRKLNPSFELNVEEEQHALLDADLVVLQTPMFWYSVPALLKNWIDEVLTYGFAYGSTGDKLRGKGFMMSMTISSPEACYQTLGYNNYTVEELLRHLKQSALMCQMIYQEPVVSHDVLYIPGIAGNQSDVEKIADDHSARLIQRIKAIDSDGFSVPVGSKKF